ncbi:hypothetical protein F511_17293 [Dorcoceras hygrometricum]|uniref:BZIP domain-containing protein n=1 Tax=Dorcoceras hygrometricum TaxID=472368 RepID=A0A2Z7B7H8_9LAMI|nr:hypothetical protein F511_17293 [Dorcoceras hygrometricum]
MTCTDEEWVAAAMTDDAMVVELLVRLHHESPPHPFHPAVVPLEWSVRQRRSKPVYPSNVPKKSCHRDSPTTALSWSGATSLSGGSAGGCEESSRQPLSKLCNNARRSEVISSSQKASSKRSRKKKNLAELKEEEVSLIKERRDLKREIATLRANLENQRSVNERLKRMKLELPPLEERELTSLPFLPDLNIPVDEIPSPDVVCGVS